MGADYLEQDVVASRDAALIVMHDIHLDRVTDVAERFPARARGDGRYYVHDFELAELRTLTVWERLGDDGRPVYPERFPPRSGSFRVHTLGEELELVAVLNRSTGRRVGVYPEIKRPAWHAGEGVDVAPLLLEELRRFGYDGRDDRAFLQCFDAAELVRIRNELGCELKLVQLIGENDWNESSSDYDYLRSTAGLRRLAKTVDAIGPWLMQLYRLEAGRPVATGLGERARRAGLALHPYTLRLDSLPEGFASFDMLLDFVIRELRVDGLFTDFPDLARRVVDAAGNRPW